MGSNTIHLLVGDVEDGSVVPVTGEKVSARLAAGLEKTGGLDPDRLELAVEAVALFARVAAMNGAAGPAVLATSAVRDAANGPEFIEGVRGATGLKTRIISGGEEARLGFAGAISALGPSWTGGRGTHRALMVDLGGGSAQLVLGSGSPGAEPEKQVSLPLGSGRTTERFVREDPPADEELDRLAGRVLKLLPKAADWDVGGAEVVAVGGSARSLLRMTRDELSVDRLRRLSREIRTRPSGVLAREQGLSPERARVLPAAVTTLVAVLERFGKERLIVARGGVREGALLALAGGKEL